MQPKIEADIVLKPRKEANQYAYLYNPYKESAKKKEDTLNKLDVLEKQQEHKYQPFIQDTHQLM